MGKFQTETGHTDRAGVNATRPRFEIPVTTERSRIIACLLYG